MFMRMIDTTCLPDDQIMDELRTGDVVLFDRSWVKRHVSEIYPLYIEC